LEGDDMMDTVESSIKSALELIPEQWAAEQWTTDGQWTIAVKRVLVSVGKSLGYSTASHGCESDAGQEWLYDVVWFRKDEERSLIDVPLVAESEWGREPAIEEDFDKLLLARSMYRVMVFQARSEEAVHNLMAKMKLWITKFRSTQPGDRYLFAGWARDHWVFEVHVS
jgi:hypothetical protein